MSISLNTEYARRQATMDIRNMYNACVKLGITDEKRLRGLCESQGRNRWLNILDNPKAMNRILYEARREIWRREAKKRNKKMYGGIAGLMNNDTYDQKHRSV